MGCLTALFVARRQLSRRALWGAAIMGCACVGFILLFSVKAGAWHLDDAGLDMTVLAAGTCLLIAVAAQTQWRSPLLLGPLRWLGQRSYEVYLTHMFVVVGLFSLYVHWGKPSWAVPTVFIAIIVTAAALGGVVASFYSEPLNRLLRN